MKKFKKTLHPKRKKKETNRRFKVLKGGASLIILTDEETKNLQSSWFDYDIIHTGGGIPERVIKEHAYVQDDLNFDSNIERSMK